MAAADELGAEFCGRIIVRCGARANSVGVEATLPAELALCFVGAVISIAAASLWRAPGRWRSKQGTLQKTYPVR